MPWAVSWNAFFCRPDFQGDLNIATNGGHIYLGSFEGNGIIINGVRYPNTVSSGLQTLLAWARDHGGRVLDIPGATFAVNIQPEIDKASSIIFNITASGFRGNSFTGEEFRYIMSHPDILRKTLFVFGATW